MTGQTWKKFLTFLEPSLELKYFLGKHGILDILNIATNSVKYSQNWKHIPNIPVSWVPWMWLKRCFNGKKQCMEKCFHIASFQVFKQRSFKELLSNNPVSKKLFHKTPFKEMFIQRQFRSFFSYNALSKKCFHTTAF